MAAFSAGFLLVFFARSVRDPVALWSVVAAALGATAAYGRAAAAASVDRVLRAAPRALLCGLALGAVVPRGEPRPEPPRAASLDARAAFVRVEGRVVASETRRGIARARLADGLWIEFRGSESPPLPGAVIAVVAKLDADGSRAVAYASAAVEVLAPPPPLHPPAVVETLRRNVADRLRRATADRPDAADVLETVLLGAPKLSAELRADLARTGALHLVAVSGSHLSLFLAGLRFATPRLRWLLPCLVAYAALTGFAPPVLRSLMLAVAASIGRRTGARVPPLRQLLLSACALLAWDGDALFDPGFQLSYAAFFGLQCASATPEVLDPFERARPAAARLRAAAVEALRASAVASLLAAPTTAWSFHQLAWLGPVATLLLAPAIPLLMLLGTACVVAPDCPACGVLAAFVVDAFTAAVGLLALVPGASVDVARPQPWALGVLCGAGVFVALRVRSGGKTAVPLAATLAAAALVLTPDRAPPGVYVLDARRGSAALLLGRRAAVLVDTGPPDARIAEKLLRLGVARIDAVLLSHAHIDHAGGVKDVVARLAVGAVLCSADDAPWLVRAGGVRGRRLRVVAAGDAFAAGDVSCRLAWPPAGYAPRDRNERSQIVDATCAGLTAWIPGDVEAAGLSGALRAHPPGPRDLLVLPHHGSANERLPELLTAVRPRLCAVSARAGFPSPQSLRDVAAAGRPLRATYVEGDVVLFADRP